jgi:peptidoglycan/xylan/chitin deacetylase (PgdA/CDA1 family)
MASELPVWKQLALTTYYWGTSLQRRWARRRLARAGQSPVFILFYHRVARAADNEWTLRFADFVRQVDWVQEHYDLVSFEQAQQRVVGEVNHRPVVSITFDDGYADNCERAFPLLIDRKIPFTCFVCSEIVLRQGAFPHDVRRGVPLTPLSLAQLRDLTRAGVEIGGHTRRHVDLGATPDRQRRYEEVAGCRDDLQDALATQVRFFAFPYGMPPNIPDDAWELTKAAGYQAVCSAYGGYNFPGEDGFHLRRIHADNDFIRFKNWLTLDPRKVVRPRTTRRFAEGKAQRIQEQHFVNGRGGD